MTVPEALPELEPETLLGRATQALDRSLAAAEDRCRDFHTRPCAGTERQLTDGTNRLHGDFEAFAQAVVSDAGADPSEKRMMLASMAAGVTQNRRLGINRLVEGSLFVPPQRYDVFRTVAAEELSHLPEDHLVDGFLQQVCTALDTDMDLFRQHHAALKKISHDEKVVEIVVSGVVAAATLLWLYRKR